MAANDYLDNVHRIHFKASRNSFGISKTLQFLEDHDKLEIKKNYYVVRVNSAIVNRKGVKEVVNRIRKNKIGNFMSLDYLPNSNLPANFNITKAVQVLLSPKST